MYDEQIEKTVLYYIIFEKDSVNCEDIKEEDFFITKNYQIIKAIKQLTKRKEEINPISIKNEIKNDGTDVLKYIAEIAESNFRNFLRIRTQRTDKIKQKKKNNKIKPKN